MHRVLSFSALALFLWACSGKPEAKFDGGDTDAGLPGEEDSGEITLPPDDQDGGQKCTYTDNFDHDGDGFSSMDGDCNDCDPNQNPGAFDLPTNGADEDCSGKADDEILNCDTGLKIDSKNAVDGAKAMDLCRTTTATATGKAKTWGVISAKYLLPDSVVSTDTDFDNGHGILTFFGKDTKTPKNSKPQMGAAMFGISSGAPRNPTDSDYHPVGGYDKGYTSGSPPPYPKDTVACPGVVTGMPHDGIALELKIRVPTNAQSFTVQEAFFTYEWPGYICSTFNDSFVIMMTPKPLKLKDGNIAFDQDGNPISVNNSLLQACGCSGGPPCTAGGKTFACKQGNTPLLATGFGADTEYSDHGATGWLTTTVPIELAQRGKEITLLFSIWDSGDGVLDSTALIDNFKWSADPATGVGTVPTPPK